MTKESTEMKMESMQKKLYELVSSGSKEDLLMSSAILIKTAI